MHGHSRRFIDDDHIIVFIQHLERNRLRLRRHRRPRALLHADALPLTHPGRALRRMSIHEHQRRFNQFLRARPAQFLTMPRHHPIESLTRLVSSHNKNGSRRRRLGNPRSFFCSASCRHHLRPPSPARDPNSTSIINSAAPIAIAESATLKAGHRYVPSHTSKKSVTAPCTMRSVTFPVAPPSSSAIPAAFTPPPLRPATSIHARIAITAAEPLVNATRVHADAESAMIPNAIPGFLLCTK